MSYDHYFSVQVTVWFKSKLENEVITTYSLPGRQSGAAEARNGVNAFYMNPFVLSSSLTSHQISLLAVGAGSRGARCKDLLAVGGHSSVGTLWT